MQDPPTRLEIPRHRRALYGLILIGLALLLVEGAARGVEQVVGRHDIDPGLGFDGPFPVFVDAPGQPGVLHPNPALAGENYQPPFAARPAEGTQRVAWFGASSVVNLTPLLPGWEASLPGPVEAIDAGVGGIGSLRVVHALSGTEALAPDVVVLYLGHNELLDEAYHPLAVSGLGLQVHRALGRSAFVRVVRWARAAWLARGIEAEIAEGGDGGLPGVLPTPQPLTRDFDAPPDPSLRRGRPELDEAPDIVLPVLARYELNLRAAVRLAKARGATPILGTVSSNLAWLLEDDALDDLRIDFEVDREPWAAARIAEARAARDAGRHAEAVDLLEQVLVAASYRMQASRLEEAIVRRVAEEEGVAWVDVRAAVEAAEPHGLPGETLHFDHCHLDDEGNRVLLEAFRPVVAAALEARRDGR